MCSEKFDETIMRVCIPEHWRQQRLNRTADSREIHDLKQLAALEKQHDDAQVQGYAAELQSRIGKTPADENGSIYKGSFSIDLFVIVPRIEKNTTGPLNKPPEKFDTISIPVCRVV
jgi:hypothetical protein